MLTKTENERINSELKKLTAQYCTDYDILRQKSEAKYKNSLRPGAVFHAQQGFYYAEDKEEFEQICKGLREKAHALIDSVALDLMAKNTAAPSTEAVNVVTLLNVRQNVSADEIDQLMTKYGHDCPMVYKALYEKAESLGYHDFKPHPTAEAAENIEQLKSLIDNRLTAYNEGRMATAAAALDMTIDAAFPAGE